MSPSADWTDIPGALAQPAEDARRIPAPTRTGRFYRPELDGLRFFSFLAVYLNHTLLFGVEGHHRHIPDSLAHVLGTIGTAGAFGVDLFFTLSAYLITELLLRERAERGSLDVRAFYMRRILRIWPLYFFSLASARLLAYLAPSEHLRWSHVLAFALFSGNWACILDPVVTVAGPLWSVSVEEQFYILWPLVVRRATTRRIALIAFGIVVVGLAVRLALALRGLRGFWLSHDSLTRIDGIAGGVLLALALRGRIPRLSGAQRAALLAAGLLTLLWVGHDFRLFSASSSVAHLALGWPIAALACAAILASILGAEGLLGRLLCAPPLVYLGRISYGLYVFHELGLFAAERLFPQHSTDKQQFVTHLVLGLAATTALAAVAYRWVERPFLRLKQRFTVVRSRPDAEPEGLAEGATSESPTHFARPEGLEVRQ